MDLYKWGAHKVVAMGCIPYELDAMKRLSHCPYQSRPQEIDWIDSQLPEAKFVYLDSYESSKDLVLNAKTYDNILSKTDREFTGLV
ncbi:Hypothetical predicted protein [Olea europaea subsp. europaea]|uniref:Uncharacterized protein n=1 Tax=Olea europaea subsp. europaea TaxID=158383 RepID=A0A8S0TYC1_OLEEU|nr:Hypothetical predicted protein [Olea europaea subsp. europaea]